MLMGSSVAAFLLDLNIGGYTLGLLLAGTIAYTIYVTIEARERRKTIALINKTEEVFQYAPLVLYAIDKGLSEINKFELAEWFDELKGRADIPAESKVLLTKYMRACTYADIDIKETEERDLTTRDSSVLDQFKD